MCIGIDAIASTPLSDNQFLNPLAFETHFKGNLNARAWMWKDHNSFAETQAVTTLAF